MSRKSKNKKAKQTNKLFDSISAERRSSLKRGLGKLFFAAIMIGGIVVGMKLLEQSVVKTRALNKDVSSVNVVLTERPSWMPVSLARKINESLVPDLSQCGGDLSGSVYELAEQNPWIREIVRVEKKKTPNTNVAIIEVAAKFRRPIAKVDGSWGDNYVDCEGVLLPSHEIPQWVVSFEDSQGNVRQACYLEYTEIPVRYGEFAFGIHYFNIQGVIAQKPDFGQIWSSEALQDGLKLIELVRTKPYAEQITVIDVRNSNGRINKNEPYLRMYAQIGRTKPTDIRFGRFPAPGGGDYVVSPERKMSYLDAYFTDHGRVAGLNSYIDLRYDELHVSLN